MWRDLRCGLEMKSGSAGRVPAHMQEQRILGRDNDNDVEDGVGTNM
jgi:hypothetical protein